MRLHVFGFPLWSKIDSHLQPTNKTSHEYNGYKKALHHGRAFLGIGDVASSVKP
jgi:hypothetical protein